MTDEISLGLIGKLAATIGTPEAGLRILISLFLGYPIALVHRKAFYGKDANLQHLYFIFTGLSLGLFNFGIEIFHCVLAVLFTYLIIFFIGGTALSVAITFIFNMGYLLTGYYYSGTNDYDINWTVPHCVLVLRLIGISYDYYDGRQPQDKLSSDSKKVALATRPGLLEFFGHMFFPTSFLIGPQFPMKRLQDFVSGKFGDDEKDLSKPPASIAYALRRFLFGMLYLVIFQVLGTLVWDDYMHSEEYMNEPFFKRCVLLGVWGRFTLYKYMSCWLLAEGACILFGLSHNGKDSDGVTQWNGLENVNLAVIENTTCFNHYIQSFNVNTNKWVAQYIYKRLKFMNNKFISQGASLTFLAIWHGFHTGYYMCFLFEFLVMYLETDLQSILKTNEGVSKFLKENTVVSLIIHILLRFYTFVFMGWCLLPFVLLNFDKYWPAYSAVNYMGIFLYIPWPIFYGPIVRLLIGKRRPRQHAE